MAPAMRHACQRAKRGSSPLRPNTGGGGSNLHTVAPQEMVRLHTTTRGAYVNHASLSRAMLALQTTSHYQHT